MVYEGRVWQHYSVCVEALQVYDQEGQPKKKENYNNQDGIEWRLQPMYLRYQQSRKNGSYWFYEAGNIKLYVTDSPTFPLRDSSKNTPRLRTDSENSISVLKNHIYIYIYWVHSEGHIWQKILNSTCRFVSDSVQYTHYFDHQPDGQYGRTRRYNILCNRGSSRTMYCPVPERKQIKWRAKQLSQVACVSEDLKPCWWLWDIPCGTKPSRTSYHRSPGGEV